MEAGEVEASDVQHLIGTLIQERTVKPWSEPVPFDNVTRITLDKVNVVAQHKHRCDDILQPIGESLIPYQTVQVYFCPKTYNPTCAFGPNGGFPQLKKDLGKACHDKGFEIYSNGPSKSGSWDRRFLCQCGRIYKGNKTKITNSPESTPAYRQNALVNDRRKNARKDGKKMPRRTTTAKPLSNSQRCPFRFTVHLDMTYGFYINIQKNVATTQHRFHKKKEANESSFPSRLLSEENLKLISQINAANASAAVARNALLVDEDKLLTRSQIRSLGGFQNMYRHPRKRNRKGGPKVPLTSEATDRLVQLVDDANYEYCMQYETIDNPVKSDNILLHGQSPGKIVTAIASVSNSTEESLTKRLADDPNADHSDATQYASDSRKSLKLWDEEELMITFAWVVPSAKRIFQLYPEVVKVDITASTNNEKRDLLTVTVKDCKGTTHVVLRCFCPNQSAWVFKWVFETCMLNLLGSVHVRRIAVVFTDGDSTETGQLDEAIDNIFINARRRRCGWHIVSRGMDVRIPKKGTIEKRLQKRYETIQANISDWIYSWMDDRTETEEEYEVSKALLLQYLSSDDFLDVCGSNTQACYYKFLKENVFPHEYRYARFKYAHLRCYGEKTSSSHEGTNNAIKYAADAVVPQNNIDRTTKTLMDGDERRGMMRSVQAFREYHHTKLWSRSSTSQKLTTMAESLVSQQQELSTRYDLKAISPTSYRVKLQEEFRQEPKGLIPVFNRVRTVSLEASTGQGRFYRCDCGLFDTTGIPCRHIIRVMSHVHFTSLIPFEISHKDVAVVHWSAYETFACQGGEDQLSILFDKLATCDIHGPAVREGSLAPSTFLVTEEDKNNWLKPSATSSCVNYKEEAIEAAIRRYGSSNNYTSVIMTQERLTQMDEDSVVELPTQGEDDFPSNWDTDEESGQFSNKNSFPSPVNHREIKELGAYHVCNPIFKELISLIDGKEDMIKSLQEDLAQRLAEAKETLHDEMNKKQPAKGTRRYVSCMLPVETRRKTHGTNYYKKK